MKHRTPPLCWHCRRIIAATPDPAIPATCCERPACQERERDYQRRLSAQRERIDRAVARSKRSFRNTETIVDERFA